MTLSGFDMRNLLLILQIITGIALSAAILVQVRGTGLGRVWGSSSSSFSRRGLEGLVFKLTFVLAFIFMLVSAISLVV
jgi:preprotein translocase subunit SecG